MPEIRQNKATKDWVIIATERAKRPEDFKSKGKTGRHRNLEGWYNPHHPQPHGQRHQRG